MLPISLLIGAALASVGTAPSIRPIQSVLAEVATETGEPIQVSPRLRGHRIYLDRKGVPVEVVLRGIAEAVSGTLLHDANGYRLERSAADERSLSKRLAAERLQWLKTTRAFETRWAREHPVGADVENQLTLEIDRLKNELDQGVKNPDRTRISQILPGQALLKNVLDGIGFEAIAKLSTGDVSVYESAVVAGASPIPRWKELVAQYSQQIQKIDSIRLREEWTQKIGGRLAGDPFASLGDDIEKLRLEVRVLLRQIEFRLEGYDRKGKRTMTIYSSAQESDGFTTLDSLVRPRPEDRSFALSAGAIQTNGFIDDPRLETIPGWLRDPERVEPLQSFVQEWVSKLEPDSTSRCVVVDVADGFINLTRRSLKDDKVGLDALKRLVCATLRYERVVGDRTIVWRSRDPLAIEDSQADRTALRRFYQSTMPKRRVEMRDRARLFFNASPRVSILTSIWSSAADATVGLPQSGDLFKEGFYRFLGSIPDDGWHRLMLGEVLTVQRLGVVQSLYRLLNEEMNLQVGGQGAVSDLYQHPLETFDSTPVGEATLRIETAQNPIEFVWSEGQPEPNVGAVSGSFEKSPGLVPYLYRGGELRTSVTRQDYDKTMEAYRFRYGSRSDVKVTIGLPHGCAIQALFEGNLRKQSAIYRYSELPESLRDSFWRKANELGIQAARAMRPPR